MTDKNETTTIEISASNQVLLRELLKQKNQAENQMMLIINTIGNEKGIEQGALCTLGPDCKTLNIAKSKKEPGS